MASSYSTITDFDQLPVPGGIVELDGTIVGVNPAAQKLLGWPLEVILGKKAWDIAPGIEHLWSELIEQAGRGAYRATITVATPDAPLLLQYAVSVREHARRQVLLFVGLETVTEQAREGSRRLEALGLVAGGIAHDFNNQLVSVLAEASAAGEDPTLSESTRDALGRIEAAALRMTQLTRQLLAYAGRGQFATEMIDPEDLVRSSEAQLSRTVRAGAALAITPAGGSVAIEADRELLLQVLVSLVTNASEALPEGGGTITVATTQTHEQGRSWWRLQVGDDGQGMDARTVERIFDPFFTTKFDRHGLGLSAVHGIVRRLGGEIGVDSKVGKGTTVDVRLPVVDAKGSRPPAPARQSAAAVPGRLRGRRVLVAEDEPSVRATIRRLLERRGADVVTANDGAEAAVRLRDGLYDFVLLDVMMPKRTGYQLISVVRQAQPNARVMLMSGYTDRARGTGSNEEPDGYLEKPFTAKALDEAIDKLLS